jgi:cyanate permease
MGVVSLGAGLFGYFGPQMLGILRDWTGSFAAGFYMVAVADVITLGLIAVLYRMTRGGRHADRVPGERVVAEGTT